MQVVGIEEDYATPTRAMPLETVRDYGFDPRGNIVDMYMHCQRTKVGRDFDVAPRHTVVGALLLRARDAAAGLLILL